MRTKIPNERAADGDKRTTEALLLSETMAQYFLERRNAAHLRLNLS